MAEPKRLLILGGTADAAALAARAVEFDGLTVINSLAGRTRSPAPLQGETRVGGFGGADGLAAYLREQRIDLVVDATHPFADRISDNAAGACAATGIARLRLDRPPWQAEPGDRWVEAADLAAAAAKLPRLGRHAFLAVGGNRLDHFAGLDMEMLVRVIDPPPSPPANATVLQGRGPFDVSEELALLREHRIDVVVSRNSGGAGAFAKIEAARQLGLPVLMIRRPAPPPGPTAASVADALAWVTARLA